jgi:hypothetical protein
MSYFAVCTFDLKNASFDDYQNAYADLAKIGFSKYLTSSQGDKITLPTTTTAGEGKIGDAPHICRFESYTGSSLYDCKHNHKSRKRN